MRVKEGENDRKGLQGVVAGRGRDSEGSYREGDRK